MTKATFLRTEISRQPAIKVGRKTILVRRITTFYQVSPGRFAGIANGESFSIEGGKAAGGTARQWFLDWPPIGGVLYCTSLVDAINQIERA